MLVHPRYPNQTQLVTGLSPEITGIGTTSTAGEGGGCILYRESDGLILVGEHEVPGQTLDIHAITLNGTAVASDVTYTIGTVTGGFGSIDQMAWLSDNEVLFAHRNTTLGPMSGYDVGRLDLTSGMITPLLQSGTAIGQIGTINALAVNKAGTIGYVGRFNYNSTLGFYTSNIYTIPLPAGTPPTLFATMPRAVTQLAVDASDNLYAGAVNDQFIAGATDLWQIDTTTGALTSLHPTFQRVNALGIEEATGNLSFVAYDPATALSGWYVGPPGGPYVQTIDVSVPVLPPLVGSVSGCAVNSNMDRYGPATPGMNSYAFEFTPNPGGLAIVGNLGFSVTVSSTPGAASGILGIAALPDNIPISGITLLVDPGSLVALFSLAAATSVTVPLGIPNLPSLSQLSVYLQTVHTEAGGFASSSGLRITIL
jgi:hypothetical protein